MPSKNGHQRITVRSAFLKDTSRQHEPMSDILRPCSTVRASVGRRPDDYSRASAAVHELIFRSISYTTNIVFSNHCFKPKRKAMSPTGQRQYHSLNRVQIMCLGRNNYRRDAQAMERANLESAGGCISGTLTHRERTSGRCHCRHRMDFGRVPDPR